MYRHLRTALLVSGLFLALPAAATAQGERLLTLADVSGDLDRLIGGTPLDFVAAARISYGVTGKRKYDDFFRNSAIAYGGFVVGQQLSDNATENLKRYARSKMAVAALQDEIAQITQGADTSAWTTEQSFAVLAAARKRDQLSAEESQYMLATAANIAATIPVVHASVESSGRLTGDVPALTDGARDAFGLMQAPGIVRNVRRSGDRVKSIPTEGPRLVESLTVLSQGLALLTSE